MSLTEQLSQRRASASKRFSADKLEIMQRATRDLEASGLAQASASVGDRLPDHSLPNARGEQVSLSALRERGPLVISFYRGGWCPYCNLELRALQQVLPEMRALSASLVAISPERPDHASATALRNEVSFEVLSDVGNVFARKLGLVFELPPDLRAVYGDLGLDVEDHNGDDRWELPLPATYVVARDGTIGYAFVDADYTKRAEPEHILAALRGLPAATDAES
ncbi:peroxiredoxin-like family protein [Haliangium sp.]|uniref:peroxiredoxin-like family protein n=1 Tax=Haliangium sp. TaxID=2663208 RepID=UPI003D0FAB65